MEIRKALASKEVDVEIQFLIAMKPQFNEWTGALIIIIQSCDKVMEAVSLCLDSFINHSSH